jgi:hypothetical protein
MDVDRRQRTKKVTTVMLESQPESIRAVFVLIRVEAVALSA